jgi:hypothetical protein
MGGSRMERAGSRGWMGRRVRVFGFFGLGDADFVFRLLACLLVHFGGVVVRCVWDIQRR